MRKACQFNAQLMDYIRPFVKPGITTGEIDRLVHDYTVEHGHDLACLGYQGFPKSCCTSVNEVVCHGIPGDYVLKSGDIVNIDVTSIVEGWFGDQSETFLIGDVSDDATRVTQTAFDCLHLAIDALSPRLPCCGYRSRDRAARAVKPTECGTRIRRPRYRSSVSSGSIDPTLPHEAVADRLPRAWNVLHNRTDDQHRWPPHRVGPR